MNYEDLITSILAGVCLLALIVIAIVIMVKYGFKQIELDIKCRKAQIHFYESASKLIDKDLAEHDGNKQVN